jgi:FMN phosphatase YigB (HAD superfamily)
MSRVPARFFLFDIGQVLLRLDTATLAVRMRSLTGLDPVQLQALMKREDLVRKFETGGLNGPQFHAEVCRILGSLLPWSEFVAAWNSILGEPLLPEDLVAAVSRRVRPWIISNTNELHFDHMMQNYSFPKHFEGFILSHEAGALKPDPRIFEYALEKMGTRAEEVGFVDDQESNVRAARDLGIDAIQFINIEQFTRELELRDLI